MGHFEDENTVTVTEEWVKESDIWVVKVVNQNGRILHTFIEKEENMDEREEKISKWYFVKEIKVLGTIYDI